MTRYIDADVLKAIFRDAYKINSNGIIGAVIDDTPTVDVIPVSYIEKQIEDNYRLADEIRAKRLYDVANSIAQYGAQIELFLEGWYEENEKAD